MNTETAKQILAMAVECGINNSAITVQRNQTVSHEKVNEVEERKIISGSAPKAALEAFEEKVASLEESKDLRFEIDTAPAAGWDCPAMKLFNLDKEEVPTSFETSDETVYLLDFWATWCGPCQGPMAHNEKMLEENPQWEGKAKIIAISLDDDVEAPKNRVAEKEWNRVGSLWAGEGGF